MVKRLAKQITENIFRSLPNGLENIQPNAPTIMTPAKHKVNTMNNIKTENNSVFIPK
jgi:hypothetical protein